MASQIERLDLSSSDSVLSLAELFIAGSVRRILLFDRRTAYQVAAMEFVSANNRFRIDLVNSGWWSDDGKHDRGLRPCQPEPSTLR